MNYLCDYFGNCYQAKQAVTLCVLAAIFIYGLYVCDGEEEK